jgi:alcohol dehydrogenase (NADP+)
MVVVGLSEKEMSICVFSLVNTRCNLAGSAIGVIQEKQEMLDFCNRYNIAYDIEIMPIQKVDEAYERVVNSDVRYRFVIDVAN